MSRPLQDSRVTKSNLSYKFYKTSRSTLIHCNTITKERSSSTSRSRARLLKKVVVSNLNMASVCGSVAQGGVIWMTHTLSTSTEHYYSIEHLISNGKWRRRPAPNWKLDAFIICFHYYFQHLPLNSCLEIGKKVMNRTNITELWPRMHHDNHPWRFELQRKNSKSSVSNVSRTCVKAWLTQPLIPCLCSAWLFENLLLVVVLRASEPTEASDCWRKLWHFIKATTESTIPARPIHIATENNNKQRESWVSCQRITPGGILQRNVPLILNVKNSSKQLLLIFFTCSCMSSGNS